MSEVAGIRELLKGPTGKAAAFAFVLLGLALAAWSIWSNVGPDQATAWSANATFVCAETGKPFTHTIQRGETLPMLSPYSGKKTGYPAELCNWTADGKPKEQFTPVLLNAYVNKPGPTFCPDCGRLVVPQNAPASPDRRPPPTRQEYEKRNRSTTQQ
jgi:hypothetical protein